MTQLNTLYPTYFNGFVEIILRDVEANRAGENESILRREVAGELERRIRRLNLDDKKACIWFEFTEFDVKNYLDGLEADYQKTGTAQQRSIIKLMQNEWEQYKASWASRLNKAAQNPDEVLTELPQDQHVMTKELIPPTTVFTPQQKAERDKKILECSHAFLRLDDFILTVLGGLIGEDDKMDTFCGLVRSGLPVYAKAFDDALVNPADLLSKIELAEKEFWRQDDLDFDFWRELENERKYIVQLADVERIYSTIGEANFPWKDVKENPVMLPILHSADKESDEEGRDERMEESHEPFPESRSLSNFVHTLSWDGPSLDGGFTSFIEMLGKGLNICDADGNLVDNSILIESCNTAHEKYLSHKLKKLSDTNSNGWLEEKDCIGEDEVYAFLEDGWVTQLSLAERGYQIHSANHSKGFLHTTFEDYCCEFYLKHFIDYLEQKSKGEKTGADDARILKNHAVKLKRILAKYPGLDALLRYSDYLDEEIVRHKVGDTLRLEIAENIQDELTEQAKSFPKYGSGVVRARDNAPLARKDKAKGEIAQAEPTGFTIAYDAWHRQTLLDFNQWLMGKASEAAGDKQDLYKVMSIKLLDFFNGKPPWGLRDSPYYFAFEEFRDWLNDKHKSMDCDRQFDNNPLKMAVEITKAELAHRVMSQPEDLVTWYQKVVTETASPDTTPTEQTQTTPKIRQRKESKKTPTVQTEVILKALDVLESETGATPIWQTVFKYLLDGRDTIGWIDNDKIDRIKGLIPLIDRHKPLDKDKVRDIYRKSIFPD